MRSAFSQVRGLKFLVGRRAGEGTRTLNPLFTRQVRYQLRHASERQTLGPGGPRSLSAPAQPMTLAFSHFCRPTTVRWFMWPEPSRLMPMWSCSAAWDIGPQ